MSIRFKLPVNRGISYRSTSTVLLVKTRELTEMVDRSYHALDPSGDVVLILRNPGTLRVWPGDHSFDISRGLYHGVCLFGEPRCISI